MMCDHFILRFSDTYEDGWTYRPQALQRRGLQPPGYGHAPLKSPSSARYVRMLNDTFLRLCGSSPSGVCVLVLLGGGG